VPRAAITLWWWIRHAPAVGRAGEILGRLDPPADLKGSRERIQELARRLPSNAAWITSGSGRCLDTARALASARGETPQPIAEPDLLEQDFGAWQGLTHAEAAARDPEAAARFWRNPASEAPPGGESFRSMLTRVAGVLETIADRHRGGDLVLIAHAGTIRAALAHALGLSAEAALRFSIDPLSLTRLDRFPARSTAASAGWRVAAVNVPPHGAELSSES
jgi:alpha-ribazole phosphatase